MPVAAGLRLLRQTDGDGLGCREDRGGVGHADGPARLRALRRAGRRLGCVGHHADRPQCRSLRRNSPEHADGQAARRTSTNPTEDELAALERLAYYRKWDNAYAKQQMTRPQTLGYGLVDSPVAQLAWIVEKFWSWTDCDGHPENALHRDEMLDNVMLYWLTASAASSARLYWESFASFRGGEPVTLPTGVAAFPKEILRAPRSWCEDGYNITHWTTMPRGGHFAAFEQPELFVDDVRAFFASVALDMAW